MSGFQMDKDAFVASYAKLYSHFQLVEQQIGTIKTLQGQKVAGNYGPYGGVASAAQSFDGRSAVVFNDLVALRNELAKFLTNAHGAFEAYQKGDEANAERLAKSATGEGEVLKVAEMAVMAAVGGMGGLLGATGARAATEGDGATPTGGTGSASSLGLS